MVKRLSDVMKRRKKKGWPIRSISVIVRLVFYIYRSWLESYYHVIWILVNEFCFKSRGIIAWDTFVLISV